jgi:hypothetical protein
MNALKPRRPPQTIARCRKPASRIFQGVSWNVLRPDFGFAMRWVWSDATKPLFGRLLSERAFAGFGGEPALALIDAVMCPSCEWRKFQCS